MKTKRVLCPIDLSENSLRAVEFAATLVDRDVGGELVLLFVTIPELPDSSGLAIESVNREIEQERLRLRQIRPRCCAGLQIRHELVRGDPATEICRFAAGEQCDLIVMTTHGRTGLTRLLMGSVAEHVLRYAPCPVVNVRSSLIDKAIPA